MSAEILTFEPPIKFFDPIHFPLPGENEEFALAHAPWLRLAWLVLRDSQAELRSRWKDDPATCIEMAGDLTREADRWCSYDEGLLVARNRLLWVAGKHESIRP